MKQKNILSNNAISISSDYLLEIFRTYEDRMKDYQKSKVHSKEEHMRKKLQKLNKENIELKRKNDDLLIEISILQTYWERSMETFCQEYLNR